MGLCDYGIMRLWDYAIMGLCDSALYKFAGNAISVPVVNLIVNKL